MKPGCFVLTLSFLLTLATTWAQRQTSHFTSRDRHLLSTTKSVYPRSAEPTLSEYFQRKSLRRQQTGGSEASRSRLSSQTEEPARSWPNEREWADIATKMGGGWKDLLKQVLSTHDDLWKMKKHVERQGGRMTDEERTQLQKLFREYDMARTRFRKSTERRGTKTWEELSRKLLRKEVVPQQHLWLVEEAWHSGG